MVTTVTNNSPQAINTSLFSLEKMINELDKKTNNLTVKGLTKIDRVNLDNLTQDGTYYSLGEDNITNKPADSMHNNIIEVVSQGNELVVQTFMYLVENEIYVRNKLNNGSWTDWVVVSNNPTSVVISVNGKQGIVVLDASDIGGLATVATSGSYNDLSNKPSLATVATSGSYNDLSNKPTIPSKTSQLTNDSDFATNSGDLGGLKLYVAYEGGSSVSISYGLFFYGSENGNVFKLFTSPTTVTPSNSFWGDPAPGDSKIMIGLYR